MITTLVLLSTIKCRKSTDPEKDGDLELDPSCTEAFKKVCLHLRCSEQAMMLVLSKRVVAISKEHFWKQLSVKGSQDVMKHFSRYLFSLVTDFVIARLNDAIKSDGMAGKK